MSVAIYPTQPGTLAPYPRINRRVPCDACARGYCQPGWCEDGIEIVSEPTAPEVNFANLSVRPLFAAIGLDAGEYLCGALDAAEIAGVIAECEAALERDASGMVLRAGMLRAAETDGRIHVAGTSDARALERLESLLGVLRWAHEHGAGLGWG